MEGRAGIDPLYASIARSPRHPSFVHGGDPELETISILQSDKLRTHNLRQIRPAVSVEKVLPESPPPSIALDPPPDPCPISVPSQLS